MCKYNSEIVKLQIENFSNLILLGAELFDRQSSVSLRPFTIQIWHHLSNPFLALFGIILGISKFGIIRNPNLASFKMIRNRVLCVQGAKKIYTKSLLGVSLCVLQKPHSRCPISNLSKYSEPSWHNVSFKTIWVKMVLIISSEGEGNAAKGGCFASMIYLVMDHFFLISIPYE